MSGQLTLDIGAAAKEFAAEAQMFFAFYLEQQIENSVFSSNWWSKFKRNDGGNWGIIGFEQGSTCRLPSVFFNNNVNSRSGTCWSGYQAHPENTVFNKRRYDHDVPNAYLNIMLKEIAKGANPTEFSEIEKENLEVLVKEGFCVMNSDGSVCINALVFKDDMKAQLNEYLNTLPEYTSLLKDMKDFIDSAKEIVALHSNKYLQEDFEYYVAMSVVKLRSTLSLLWKNNGLYTGESGQFCAFFC